MQEFIEQPELDFLSEYEGFVYSRFKTDTKQGQLIHAALGVAGEAGELVDAIKKHAIYGKPLDLENVREEIGDTMFYLVAALNTLGITMESVLQQNMDKLTKRYPVNYSNEDAIARADKKA